MQHPLDSHRVLANEPPGIGPEVLGNGIADVGYRDFGDKTTAAIKSSACRWSWWGFAAGFGVAGIQLGKRVGGGLVVEHGHRICQHRSQETPAPKHQRSAPQGSGLLGLANARKQLQPSIRNTPSSTYKP